MKHMLIAQSGGPSAAINATVAGVVERCMTSGQVGRIYGARNGIKGVIDGNYIDLTEELASPERLELLCHTPAAALGSCRLKVNPGNQTDGDAAATLLKRSVFVAAHRANSPASEYPPMMQGCFFSPIYARISLSVLAAFSPKDSLLKTAGAFQGDKSRFQSSTLHAIRHNSSETDF